MFGSGRKDKKKEAADLMTSSTGSTGLNLGGGLAGGAGLSSSAAASSSSFKDKKKDKEKKDSKPKLKLKKSKASESERETENGKSEIFYVICKLVPKLLDYKQLD